jgi:hypothetical protein
MASRLTDPSTGDAVEMHNRRPNPQNQNGVTIYQPTPQPTQHILPLLVDVVDYLSGCFEDEQLIMLAATCKDFRRLVGLTPSKHNMILSSSPHARHMDYIAPILGSKED